MQLSVIIVNYNVRYFLEPCLRSVHNAMAGMDAEVIVVDNNSVDDSVKMVRELFPWVKLVANTENLGFSKANNQGIRMATGKYILLLNPDTLVQEDTFRACFDFMEAHQDAGALGVRMIDGSGRFLPESKRGFPSPFVAFSKATGLSALFPRSKTFNRYHLGYLDEHQTHEVDVLSGAFMFIRKSVLDQIGLLDEDFFMYGEDIDLSYRIVQAGYKNYYFPETGIVHYKGESTKKGSLNYVVTFYKAMIIFARKHFSGRRQKNLVWFLQLAVFARAMLTIVKNAFRRISWPLADLVIIYLLFNLTEMGWARGYHADPDYYPMSNAWINYPVYAMLFVLSAWLSGLYEKEARWNVVFRSVMGGLVLSLVFYALAPLDYRSSRAIILLGSGAAGVYMLASRMIRQWRQTGRWALDNAERPRIGIIGSQEEIGRVIGLLDKAGISYDFIGGLSPSPEKMEPGHINHLNNLKEFSRLNRVDELIFCARDIPIQEITHWMGVCGPAYAYKVIVEHGSGIVGSRSKNTAGQLYTLELSYRLADPVHRREKRIFDIALSLVMLPLWPLTTWWTASPVRHFLAIFRVLAGRMTWVGYAPGEPDPEGLPPLRKGVLHILSGVGGDEWTPQEIHHQHFLYARDYRLGTDLGIVLRGYRQIGKNG